MNHNLDLLTPKEAMDLLRIKSPKTLAAMARAGLIKRVNKGAGLKQPRWAYIVDLQTDLEPDAKWLDLKRRCGL